MSQDLVILVPVRRRPQNVRPLLDSIRGTTAPPWAVYFITDPDDTMEALAIDAEIERLGGATSGVTFSSCAGNYAVKINYAIERTRQPLIFMGADDLRFHPGWREAVERKLDAGYSVVGTNDLGDPTRLGIHSTHTLITRRYVEAFGTIDQKGKALHEGYVHNFVDDELVGTAKSRGAFAVATDAVVEHLHPDWGKGVMDSTYEIARDSMEPGRAVYNQRCRLWGGQPR